MMNRKWVARIGAMGLAFVLGASASAGTLYSWKTEDGTFAYTNEKKRIPARYKGEAAESNLKSMKSYDRFTPGPKLDETSYGDRIVERLEVLRGNDTYVPTAAGTGFAAAGGGNLVRINAGSGINSGTEINIPVGAQADDMEPVVIEHVRMKPGKGRSATRHFKIVKQGDRILAVIKDRLKEHDRSSDLSEDDFDSSPLQ
jgi:hypothetical protein